MECWSNGVMKNKTQKKFLPILQYSILPVLLLGFAHGL
jgi:hypothetical protein